MQTSERGSLPCLLALADEILNYYSVVVVWMLQIDGGPAPGTGNLQRDRV